MAKKLYYTDPLAAAYMAREFGVKFNIYWGWGHTSATSQPLADISSDKDSGNLELHEHKDIADEYHIHPDSYHIFEPQVGDFIEFEFPGLGRCIEKVQQINKFSKDYSYYFDGDLAQYTYKEVLPKIIQRKNKSFFWPESE